MNAIITMRELQAISARDIAALPRGVTIQSDGETVGLVTPIRKATSEEMAEFVRLVEELDAGRTPEQRVAIADILREIGEA